MKTRGPGLALVHRIRKPWSFALARIDPRHFYIGLALVLAIWVLWTNLFDRRHQRESATYDWMLVHRFRMPPPDPEIVVLDIDERSLAAMAADYGQWPWPRDVLATVLQGLEAEGAKAVVFDILFADPDRQHPVSEQAFERAVAASRIAYFPVLRLAPANDGQSAFEARDLKGLVVPVDPGADAAVESTRTLAMVLPYFDSAVRSGRLGTHNLDPDVDGLVRRYRVWEEIDAADGSFRIVSLPVRMALDFGWPMPDRPQKLLRFHRQVPAYRTVSFSDVHADFLRRQRTRPADEFRDRIVVIGSTASGLFDLKGTPVSSIHPGVDLLATAIDDTKNARFIDELSVPEDIAIGLLLLVLMPWLCIRYSHEQLRAAFVVAPALLFGISYLSLNFSNAFIDLASPASIAFVYFTVVKVYSVQVRKRWGEEELLPPVFDADVAYWAGCLAVSLPASERVAGFETRYLNLLRSRAPHVRLSSGLGMQTGLIGSVFSDVLVASWIEPADDHDAIEVARREAGALDDGLRGLHRGGVRLATRFLEQDIDRAGDGLAASRPGALRALVSRTLLRISEGKSA